MSRREGESKDRPFFFREGAEKFSMPKAYQPEAVLKLIDDNAVARERLAHLSTICAVSGPGAPADSRNLYGAGIQLMAQTLAAGDYPELVAAMLCDNYDEFCAHCAEPFNSGQQLHWLEFLYACGARTISEILSKEHEGFTPTRHPALVNYAALTGDRAWVLGLMDTYGVPPESDGLCSFATAADKPDLAAAILGRCRAARGAKP
ncbi:MAG TPA: hypothetical protein VJB02_06300 [Coxiellaceae bacterium]|nr:hypothetical protein [Coxiellaceae bacterium]